MSTSVENNREILIRPAGHRDLEEIALFVSEFAKTDEDLINLEKQIAQVRKCYALLQFFNLFPNPFQNYLRLYIAEQFHQLRGLVQVSPFNSSRSTWRVERVLTDHHQEKELRIGKKSIGSQLLRHCFETVWEARTWLLEVNINDHDILALYRQNGFQPLAQMTYWSLSPEILQQLAQQEPDLPNFLPVSNADAQLLYQLDTLSMPPLLRQVFDRHIQDFKTNILAVLLDKLRQWFEHTQTRTGYVFEPQRKAAIGFFNLELSKDGSVPHQVQLTVHPAYTWLYPKLFALMAQLINPLAPQSLSLVSGDYQPEREEYLEQLGATRTKHSLLMSRSVWHKLRESKPLEALNLSEVLQGLHPARTPIPSRISWLEYIYQMSQANSKDTPRSSSSEDEGGKENPE
jgi:hypothetical protein